MELFPQSRNVKKDVLKMSANGTAKDFENIFIILRHGSLGPRALLDLMDESFFSTLSSVTTGRV